MARRPQKQSKNSAPENTSWFSRNRFAVALFIITLLVYSNSLRNDYAMDDDYYISKGEVAGETGAYIKKGIKGIPAIFKTRTFFNPDGSNYAYRPIVAASFALEYQFFGASPGVSHFISVLLYAFTVILLFSLFRKWFVTLGDWFSFFAALLFLVHPLHSEIVDNIKSRDELFSLLGALGCIHFVWKKIHGGSWYNIIWAILCFLFGMLSKHTILVYLVLFPIILWFFTDADWKKILLYSLPLIAAVAITSLANRAIPQGQRFYLFHENPLTEGDYSFAEKTATSSYVMGRYLALHFVPHPLVYYYGFRYIPIVGWTNIIAILSLLVHAGLGLLSLKGLRSKQVWSFAILVYLGGIVPFSNLLQPAPGLMAERFAYTASIGFCIGITWLIFRLTKISPESFSWQYSVRTKNILLVIVALFAVRTFVRNFAWEDKLTLYSNDMEYLGESAKANMLYAQYLARDAQTRTDPANVALAQYHFKKAIDVFPDYKTAWSNYGATFYYQKKYDSAMVCLKKALSLDTANTQTYFMMGMTFQELKKPDSAQRYFLNSIRIDSSFLQSYRSLAELYASHGKTGDALRVAASAAQKNPKKDWPFLIMSEVYRKYKSNPDSAAICAEIAIEYNPRNARLLQDLVRYFSKKGDVAKAQKYKALFDIEASRVQKTQPQSE